MIDNHRLANIIFDNGKKILQKDYSIICESINDDRFTLNAYVIAYKKKDAILEDLFFSLKNGSRVLISEEALSMISSLKLDKDRLVEYMSESKENFQSVLREIINGVE